MSDEPEKLSEEEMKRFVDRFNESILEQMRSECEFLRPSSHRIVNIKEKSEEEENE